VVDIPVGDALQFARKEDIAGNCLQPVVVVREAKHTRIKGDRVGQQETALTE
jgi:hypothetical protein